MAFSTPTARTLVPRALAASAVLSASIVLAALPASASQSAVLLGTADSFAVLAGSGITNTGPTTITGDIGTYPTPTETGTASITLIGTDHAGDAVTQGAKDDLLTAYNDAAGRSPVTNVPVELGGTRLLGGVYASPTFGLTGTLTLDSGGNPDATFVFKAGSTLITEANSRVLLIGVDPCHVVWQVGSSATFKTGTSFVGDVLSHTSITAQTQATFRGRLLAMNGAVTLDTNTITRSSCAAASSAPEPEPETEPTAPTPTPTPTPAPDATPAPTPSAPATPPATTPVAEPTASAPVDSATPESTATAGVAPAPETLSTPVPTAPTVAPVAVRAPAARPLVVSSGPTSSTNQQRVTVPTAGGSRPATPPLAATGLESSRLAWLGAFLVVFGGVITCRFGRPSPVKLP